MARYVPQGYQSVSGDPSGYLTQYENQGFEQLLEDDVDDNGNSSHPGAPAEGRTATGKGKKPQQPEKKKDPYKALASIEHRLATRVKNLEKAQKVLQNHFTRLSKMEADKDRYREENLEDQRNKIARKQNEINGLQEAIHDLEERREMARNETVQHTPPTTSQDIEVKPKRRRKKTKRPDTWDPFEGDDSASDKGEPLKKQKQSCRHCQVNKAYCDNDIPRCGTCIVKGKKCRYTEMFSGRQILPGAHMIMMKKISEQTAELERLRQQALLSNGQGHPLSGITGYGSRPKQFAKNNLLRMFQGREPLPYNENNSPARSRSGRRSEPHHSLSGSRSRSEDTSESRSERPSTTVPDPNPTLRKRRDRPEDQPNEVCRRSKRQRGADPSPTQDEQAIPDQGPSNDPSGDSPEDQSRQSWYPINHAEGVTEKQLQWASTLAEKGLSLPLTQDGLPDWPSWTLDNERSPPTDKSKQGEAVPQQEVSQTISGPGDKEHQQTETVQETNVQNVQTPQENLGDLLEDDRNKENNDPNLGIDVDNNDQIALNSDDFHKYFNDGVSGTNVDLDFTDWL